MDNKINQFGELAKHTNKLESNKEKLHKKMLRAPDFIVESCLNQGLQNIKKRS